MTKSTEHNKLADKLWLWLSLFGLFTLGALLTAILSLICGAAESLTLTVLVICGSLLQFGLPGLLWRRTYKHKLPISENATSAINARAIINTILLSVVCQPVVDWFAYINKIRYHEWGFTWLSDTLQANNAVLAKVLQFDTPLHCILSIVSIALLPAVCEELFFRGALFNAIRKSGCDDEGAVILSALIFSAMHLDPEGIVPRFLLGALIGILYVFAGNIILPIIFHICNNLLAVIVLGTSDQPIIDQLSGIPTEAPNVWLSLLSLVLTMFFIWAVQQTTPAIPKTQP